MSSKNLESFAFFSWLLRKVLLFHLYLLFVSPTLGIPSYPPTRVFFFHMPILDHWLVLQTIWPVWALPMSYSPSCNGGRIKIADDSHAYFEGTGRVCNLYFSFICHLQFFVLLNCPLTLSLSGLINSFNCSFYFWQTHCVIQNLFTRGGGYERGGSYILNLQTRFILFYFLSK